MDRPTEDKIVRIAVHATILVAKLEDLVGSHPDETDSESVVPLHEIEELLEEFKDRAYPSLQESVEGVIFPFEKGE